jgi:hypothetical protein
MVERLTSMKNEQEARNLCGLGQRMGSNDMHGSLGANASRGECSVCLVTQPAQQNGNINYDSDSAI